MTNILIIIGTLVTAAATVAIAFFAKRTFELTKATDELTNAIKESSEKHQDDMKKLQVDLVAAQLYASSTPQGKSLSTNKLDDFRKFIANNLK